MKSRNELLMFALKYVYVFGTPQNNCCIIDGVDLVNSQVRKKQKVRDRVESRK